MKKVFELMKLRYWYIVVKSFPFKLVLQYQAAEEALKADRQLVR